MLKYIFPFTMVQKLFLKIKRWLNKGKEKKNGICHWFAWNLLDKPPLIDQLTIFQQCSLCIICKSWWLNDSPQFSMTHFAFQPMGIFGAYSFEWRPAISYWLVLGYNGSIGGGRWQHISLCQMLTSKCLTWDFWCLDSQAIMIVNNQVIRLG